MFNKICICSVIIIITGCAVPPKFNIESSAPAYIEVDGEIYCEKTPCEITPPHYVDNFGQCMRNRSLKSIITAFPIDKTKGFVQQKVVRATCDNNKKLYYDMDVTGGVQTIEISK